MAQKQNSDDTSEEIRAPKAVREQVKALLKAKAQEQAQHSTAPTKALKSSAKAAKQSNGATATEALVAVAKRKRSAVGRLRPWHKVFLKAFAQCGIIRVAAEQAGIGRTAIHDALHSNPKFAAQYAEALVQADELIEAHALRRATVGEPEPLFMNTKNGPVQVATLMRKSDRLLEFILKARRPEKYRENIRQEISGPNGAPLQSAIIPTQVNIVIPDNGRGDRAGQQVTVDVPAQVASDTSG